MNTHYDVAALGAGPAGTPPRSAPPNPARASPWSEYWGSACLNVGCIPFKALLRNAELAHAQEPAGSDGGQASATPPPQRGRALRLRRMRSPGPCSRQRNSLPTLSLRTATPTD